MQITHLGHSTVLIESAGTRILIDPGNFGSAWHSLTGLDAIVITHSHPDHADPEALPALLAANPKAAVLTEPTVPAIVALPQARALHSGDEIAVGGLTMKVVGGWHAVIHPDIPPIGNVGVVLSAAGEPTFFHPGDELDTIPPGIDILAIPAYGPWADMEETIDFVRAVKAPWGFLIHDGLLGPRGWNLVFGRLNAMTNTTVVDLRDQRPWAPPND